MIRPWALLSAAILLYSFVYTRPAIADAPATSGWGNPFCSGDVSAFPWNKDRDEPVTLGLSKNYGLSLFADGKSTVSATVILITSDGAYTVSVDRNPLLRQAGKDTHRRSSSRSTNRKTFYMRTSTPWASTARLRHRVRPSFKKYGR